tara:strand:+ start:448 stop:966 length:519 start_codon:yes stop_codon:yes gene_type:complete
MKYATGKYALALCDRCGQQYDYVVLRKEWNGLRVCPDCYEEKHPQLEPDPPPYEPQALFEPRPDQKETLDILIGQNTFPLLKNISTQGISTIGLVTISLTDFDPSIANVSGLFGTSAVGSVEIVAYSGTTVNITGVQGSGSVGSVTVSQTSIPSFDSTSITLDSTTDTFDEG